MKFNDNRIYESSSIRDISFDGKSVSSQLERDLSDKQAVSVEENPYEEYSDDEILEA